MHTIKNRDFRCDSAALPVECQRPYLTIGNFDGVHRGHQELVRRLVDLARREGGTAIAMTFEPHPVRFFKGPEHPCFRLTTPGQRERILAGLGIDVLIVLPFDEELASLSPEAFVEDLVVARIGARHVMVGYDFNFGHRRAGSAETLQQLGDELGFAATSFGPYEEDGQPVSSSRVRRAVRAGDMPTATQLLGRPFALHGVVERGQARGRDLGFPTANLRPGMQVVPASGIYVTELVLTATGERLPGVTNVGTRPTFVDDRGVLVETFVIDAAELDLYDAEVEVVLHERLRDEERFETVEALVEQMHEDVRLAREAHTRLQSNGDNGSAACGT